MSSAEETDLALKQYLQSRNLKDSNTSWKLDKSKLGGRGVFATRDVKVNETIMIDSALILGPRASINTVVCCVNCYRSKVVLNACSKGCGLPVCSKNCEESIKHESECSLILKWLKLNSLDNFKEWSLDMYRCLSMIRSLFLTTDQKKVLLRMSYFTGKNHGHELELLRRNGIINLRKEEKEFLYITCCILDTNTYETSIKKSETDFVSLRGLYPAASMLNHCCTPNTSHSFSNNEMKIYATRDIRCGEELTSTYTNLLWSTMARRHHLYVTKQFYCNCQRCIDSSEFGSRLSGMKCVNSSCSGVLLPKYPLDINTIWECDECARTVTSTHIAGYQNAVANLANTFDTENLLNIIKFAKEKIISLLPPCNQIVVEFKCKVMWKLGMTEGFLWNELSDELLEYKETLCREMIQLVNRLQLGECQIKHLLSNELLLIRNEKQRRSEQNQFIQPNGDNISKPMYVNGINAEPVQNGVH